MYAADDGMRCRCAADGRMMQIWEVPTEETFRLAAAGEGYRLTLLPDRCAFRPAWHLATVKTSI